MLEDCKLGDKSNLLNDLLIISYESQLRGLYELFEHLETGPMLKQMHCPIFEGRIKKHQKTTIFIFIKFANATEKGKRRYKLGAYYSMVHRLTYIPLSTTN